MQFGFKRRELVCGAPSGQCGRVSARGRGTWLWAATAHTALRSCIALRHRMPFRTTPALWQGVSFTLVVRRPPPGVPRAQGPPVKPPRPPQNHTSSTMSPSVVGVTTLVNPRQAFREPKGYLWPPGHPLLAELVPYDPLPETVLELQQAQVAQVAAQVGTWVSTCVG